MGYWDTHPMAGDPPMDAEYDLRNLLFSNEEQEKDLNFNEELYKKRLEERLYEAVSIEFYRNQQFILPFKVAEHNIKINDKELSLKIKNMIGDGGASDRGYSLDESNASNSYNEFQSPYDFARALYDNWDSGMKGEMDLSTIGESVGLFDKLALSIENGNTGLINKK